MIDLIATMEKVREDCRRMAEYVREHPMYDPLIDGSKEDFLKLHPGVTFAHNL